jgi:CheY-like chemotaxis protein
MSCPTVDGPWDERLVAGPPERAGNPRPARVILVVGSEAWTRAFLVRMFRRKGYSAHASSGAKAALRRIKSDPSINVVFTDLAPRESGATLTAAAKALRPDLDVVLGYDIRRRLRPTKAPAAAVDAFLIAEQIMALIEALPGSGTP